MKRFTLFLLLFFGFYIGRAQTVVDIIVNSPDHTILETAVLAAGLEGALSGDGPFTVFAPTDEAFNALPAGTIETLLKDPQGALTDILLYHVASGNVLSTDLSDGQVITTLSGEEVTVTINTNGVFINEAQVTVADLVADNGVVHVINAVLLPPPPVTVVDIIVNSPDHTILETAVLAAGLEGALSGDGPFTVFAPTDAAFNALPAGTLETLLEDPQGALTDILLYHVASGNVLSTDLSDGQVITTLNGDEVIVTINANGVFINEAQVTVADLVADNGVVHVINAVLSPSAGTRNTIQRIEAEIFPNPASQMFIVEMYDQSKHIQKLDLIDVHGKIVGSWSRPSAQYEVHLTNIPSGVYTLLVEMEDGALFYDRVSIQK